MKFVLMALVMGVAGYFAWQQMRPANKTGAATATPVPTAPPPAIYMEPAPLISPEEQAKIAKSANDQDPAVRWEAILFLDKMKSPAVYDIMFEKLQGDPDTDLRLKIITLLSQRGAAKTVVQASSTDPLNPTTAPEAAARDKRNAAITQNLVWATKDQVPEVRLAALSGLDAMGDYSVASAITDCLKDQDERVRLLALKTLNNLQDKKAVLIEAERKRQEELRRQAEAAKAAK